MEFKIGDVIKRPYWPEWGTIVDMKPGEFKILGHIPGYNHALWYDADLIEWEKQEPKVAKIGDIITGPLHAHWKYIVYEVDGPFLVRLSKENGVKLGTWFDLRYEQAWSINGVKCSEFFGNGAAQQPAPIPVEVPKRKKRIYNA